MAAKANGNRLEATRGLRLGARVGVIAALIVIAVDLFGQFSPIAGTRFAGIDYLNPIPKYIYAAIYGIYDGLMDVVTRNRVDEGVAYPGQWARYAILLVSTFLFGAFGGGIAASTFLGQPTTSEEPERSPRTPVVSGWMRHNVGSAQGMAQQVRREPALAGTAAGAMPGPVSRAAGAESGESGQPPARRPMPQPVFDQAAQGNEPALPARSKQTSFPEPADTAQSAEATEVSGADPRRLPDEVYEEAARRQVRQRPRGEISLTSESPTRAEELPEFGV